MLIVLSIPLMLRWVPPNRVYGFRVPVTLRNRSIWYDANALCARHFCMLGLLMVLLEFMLPMSLRISTLRLVAIAGLALITVVDWKIANQWERERSPAA